MLTTYHGFVDVDVTAEFFDLSIRIPPHIPGVTHVNFTKDMQDVMSERDIFLTNGTTYRLMLLKPPLLMISRTNLINTLMI